jgi:IMP dehydrogenase
MNYNSFSSSSLNRDWSQYKDTSNVVGTDTEKYKRVLSFNDIKIKPVLTNINSKKEVQLVTKLTNNVNLKTPFILLSSNVEELVDINTNGGLGIVKKIQLDDQINIIKKIKRHINIFNTDIITVNAYSTFVELQEIFKNEEVEYVFVLDYYSVCTGMIFRQYMEINAICNVNNTTTANEIMTEISKIKYFNQYDYDWLTMTANPVKFILDEFKMTPVIPILCENKKVLGVLSLKDLIKFYKLKDNLLFDGYGKLLAAACIGISNDYVERINKLVYAGLDILYLNIDNAYNNLLFEVVKDTKTRHPNLVIIVGNINTVDGYKSLNDIGVDAVVVGDETEFGQYSLLQECRNVYNIPIINNSGIPSQEKNIFKALLAGADTFLIEHDKTDKNDKGWKEIYTSKSIIYPMVSVNIKTISELHSSNIECMRLN